MADFYKRLKESCEENNITISAMLNAINVTSPSASKWKTGTIPNGETLIKISEYLNVSIDYLLKGEKKTSQNITKSTVGAIGTQATGSVTIARDSKDELEEEMIKLFRKLSIREKIEIIQSLYNKGN